MVKLEKPGTPWECAGYCALADGGGEPYGCDVSCVCDDNKGLLGASE